jgi:hypothetical protein
MLYEHLYSCRLLLVMILKMSELLLVKETYYRGKRDPL